MTYTRELPPPAPQVNLHVPFVALEPAWEYLHLVRELTRDRVPHEDDLNALGAEGWELAGVVADGGVVHFYLKRAVRK